MNRVLISVEGQTEETFVRDVLTPHLWEYDVDPTPVLLSTKIVKSGRKFKGGLVSYSQARSEIHRLLNDSAAVAVTTMYDLYGLPQDFPGYAAVPRGDCYTKVAHLEEAFGQDIGHRRFRPYLQLHEFEALMFVDPQRTAAQFPGVNRLDALGDIKAAFNSPEEIDDDPNNAPSKRLLELFPGYQKTLHGPLATVEVGLDQIRGECPHFDEWLEWLEGLW